jgi:hypothetical protein
MMSPSLLPAACLKIRTSTNQDGGHGERQFPLEVAVTIILQ